MINLQENLIVTLRMILNLELCSLILQIQIKNNVF